MTKKKLTIATGTDLFGELVTSSGIFVDKSMFIREVLDSGDKVILVTRPRRWGKTLALDMLRAFFSNEHGNQTNVERNLRYFEPLKIFTEDGGAYMQKQGKHPVVFISFKDVTALSYSQIEVKIGSAIAELFKEHWYLHEYLKLQGSVGSADDLQMFERIVSKKATDADVKASLKFLTRLLRGHYGARVYVLVDEYDKPVNHLLSHDLTFKDGELQRQVSRLITAVLGACGKDNAANLEKIIMMGIFDSLQREGESGFNNVEAFGVDSVRFSRSFGFSEEEVARLVDQLEFGHASDSVTSNVRSWYNGYNVRTSGAETIKVYTPWAVMLYLKSAYLDADFVPQSYWTASGASTILQRLLTQESCATNSSVSRKLSAMAHNNSVVELDYTPLTSLCTLDLSFATQDERVFAYLLLSSGYLTIARSQSIDGLARTFALPNAEVRTELSQVLVSAAQKANSAAPTFCKKILDNLNRPKHIRAVRAIRDGNVEGLSSLFREPGSLSCEDDSLNFNYFHLATAYGNADVLAELEVHCDVKLSKAPDVYGLVPQITLACLTQRVAFSVLSMCRSVFQIQKHAFFVRSTRKQCFLVFLA